MATIIGTSGDDLIKEPEFSLKGDDRIEGLAGNDTVEANNGNDEVVGADGEDSIDGGSGNDDLVGSDGNDIIKGKQGRDLLFGDSGEDILNGGNGDDLLDGGFGNDRLFGEKGNDTLQGTSFGSDLLNGGSGNDILDGVIEFSLSLSGQGEIDTLTGGSGGDTFVLGGGTFVSRSGSEGISAQVYYDDGDSTTVGSNDYALITDFKKNTDIIQLKGTPNDYILDSTFTIDGRQGTAIFLKDDVNELIGLAENVFDLDLNNDNFSFV